MLAGKKADFSPQAHRQYWGRFSLCQVPNSLKSPLQGRDESGRMNNKSGDETYNNLLVHLRETLKPLTQKIIPKVYKYDFLKK
jgi:hypothetical protein